MQRVSEFYPNMSDYAPKNTFTVGNLVWNPQPVHSTLSLGTATATPSTQSASPDEATTKSRYDMDDGRSRDERIDRSKHAQDKMDKKAK